MQVLGLPAALPSVVYVCLHPCPPLSVLQTASFMTPNMSWKLWGRLEYARKQPEILLNSSRPGDSARSCALPQCGSPLDFPLHVDRAQHLTTVSGDQLVNMCNDIP